MLVPYSKFGRNNDSLVNVLNVKLKPEEIRQLIGIEGYELAYHMNKKYWLSILLDETRNDKEILSSIRKSYSLTE
jgi:predicted DNA-binding protein (MmcQ/YjbR family)